MQNLKHSFIGLTLAGITVMALAGCGSSNAPAAAPASAADIEAQIKKIQDDPKMPESAKKSVIDNIRKSQTQGK